ncbi:hypothetical protein GGQ74_001152 [Desulfobaculum xiamenense]|uniref:Uncharacterized protein n=1 Tax=Desulfobaculum xiamenense TaxID=995050 RepID=A0A846QM31_9BACT|nr:hypothetical protein [Desulfobaculum xiamenense]NJB67512.1 hypothetical protein [Desulfobaculum xiamenense]
MEAVLAWLAANADWLIPTALIVADKAVALSPTKYDDLILTSLKAVLKALGKLPKVCMSLMLAFVLLVALVLVPGCSGRQGDGAPDTPTPEEIMLHVAQAEAAYETAIAGYELLLSELNAEEAAKLAAKVGPIIEKADALLPLLRHAAELYAAGPEPECAGELLARRTELAAIVRDIARLVREFRRE